MNITMVEWYREDGVQYQNIWIEGARREGERHAVNLSQNDEWFAIEKNWIIL